MSHTDRPPSLGVSLHVAHSHELGRESESKKLPQEIPLHPPPQADKGIGPPTTNLEELS